jgi:hypothetical protein
MQLFSFLCSCLGPKTFITTLLSNVLNLCSSHLMRDHCLQLHTSDKIRRADKLPCAPWHVQGVKAQGNRSKHYAKRRTVVSVTHARAHTQRPLYCWVEELAPPVRTRIWSRSSNEEKKFLPHQSVNVCYPNFSGKKCILIYFNLSNIHVGRGHR